MRLTWPPKQINEVLDFKLNWIDALDGDTVISSQWSIVGSGSGLTIDRDDLTQSATVVWLAGGVAGVHALRNTIQTAGGRTLVATVKLPVRV